MEPWVEQLNEEDLQFIKRFIMASGSLKELAQLYGVTYPTIRLRLDRLIEKTKLLESELAMDEYEKELRKHYADGKLELATFQALLKAYRSQSGSGERIKGN